MRLCGLLCVLARTQHILYMCPEGEQANARGAKNAEAAKPSPNAQRRTELSIKASRVYTTQIEPNERVGDPTHMKLPRTGSWCAGVGSVKMPTPYLYFSLPMLAAVRPAWLGLG